MCYSLVKPPKGSNITGSELLETLIKPKENLQGSSNKIEWLRQLDNLIENGFIESEDNDVFNYSQTEGMETLIDHDYDVNVTSPYVLNYIAGYIVRKASRFTKCLECRSTLETKENREFNRFIDLMNNGDLYYPSVKLEKLLTELECKILEVIGKLGIHINSLSLVLQEIKTIKKLHFIGCAEHTKYLTKKIAQYYIITRGHFIAKKYNTRIEERRKKTQMHRKMAKIV